MCYIFDTLMQNELLHPGDTIALAVPTFTPYIEIAHMDRFAFKVVNVDAGVERYKDGAHTWQYSDSEIDKLANRSIKAFFLVNPSNPPSFAMRKSSMQRLVKLVKTKRRTSSSSPMTFMGRLCRGSVPAWPSCRKIPFVYTPIPNISVALAGGWVWWPSIKTTFSIKCLPEFPAKTRAALNRRYGPITLEPEKLRFIDRMVADSRMVALNHTAGLSLPQQIQMALFSAFALLDKIDSYKALCQLIVRRRFRALLDGLGLTLSDETHVPLITSNWI